MKGKITIAAALATIVTIGGVYATWSFAEKDADAATTTANIAMTGTEAVQTGKGTLSVKVMDIENSLMLAVDDSDNNHKPELVKKGNVEVTFTPANNAPTEIKENGISVSLVVSYAPYVGGAATFQAWQYESTQIFQFSEDDTKAQTDAIVLENKLVENGGSMTLNQDGTFTWIVDASQIAIDLTDAMKEVVIDRLDEYTDLNEILAKGHFVFGVSEYKAPAQAE